MPNRRWLEVLFVTVTVFIETIATSFHKRAICMANEVPSTELSMAKIRLCFDIVGEAC